MKNSTGAALAGSGAGILNGLFGAGGGMVLSPLLTSVTDLDDQTVFPCSVAILFPICIVSLLFSHGWETFSLQQALPYLIGSLLGGICAGFWGRFIPTGWLHKVLGILILWGGLRYLW
jgi:uncharacterized membrane protein YfcA